MSGEKPTLIRLTLRRHLWAAVVTLLLLLLGVLLFTDLAVLYARRHALAEQLFSVESVNDELLMLIHNGQDEQGNGRTGTKLLNIKGYWEVTRKGQTKLSSRRWAEASVVQRAPNHAMHGMGYLPWLKEKVIWAARVIPTPNDDPQILVAWERVDAVRMVRAPLYIGMGIATLVAFGVSILLALRSVRDVRRVLEDIADSSTRMAAGDFHIQLAPQPALELDKVTTSLNQLAQELDQTTVALHTEHERLIRLERLQRQFVADASHELRAPLTSIRVTLEAWQDGVLRSEEYGTAMTKLLTETERLSALVFRLLDLSRIESGRESVTCEPVVLAEVAQIVATGFSALPGAPVVSEIPPALPLVLADREALRRILQNFVENARRFTPADGRIRLWAEAVNGQVRVGVTDTGVGIAADFLPRIWDRFARAPEARASGKAGSGLGLAIAKALAEEMDGTVGATSELGVGTTIWVSLLIAPQADEVAVKEQDSDIAFSR